MSYNTFYHMTYGDVMIAISGYFDQEYRENVRSRAIAYNVYCSIPEGRGKKKKAITKWWPLPGDDDYKETEQYSHEDRIARLQAFREKSLGK